MPAECGTALSRREKFELVVADELGGEREKSLSTEMDEELLSWVGIDFWIAVGVSYLCGSCSSMSGWYPLMSC